MADQPAPTASGGKAPDLVNPSVVPPITKSVLSDILIVATAFPLITAAIGKRDVVGLITFLQSVQGGLFLAVVLPIAASGWRARLRVLRWIKAVRWARSASNDVAIVKEATPPPSA